MSHHKRRRPKNRRAGCLMCKPHKANNAKMDGPRGTKHPLAAMRKMQKDHEEEVES